MDRYRTDTNSPAVIIGAGPAGLTAGYELFKLGHPSVILEADEMVGGISRTVNYQGYRFDIGGHRFFSKVPYVNDLWHEILQDDFILRPRLSRIHYKGHFFDYPLKAMNALAGLGPYEAMMVMLSYLRAKAIPYNGGSEDNFEQWVANRFGYRLYSIFFKTYTEKVWGIPCHEISADWAAQRIKNLSLKRAIYNALVGSAKSMNGEVITTLIEQFHYPRLGPGMMWERCAELLEAQGSPTVFGQPVQQIYHHNGRVTAIKALNRRGESTEITGREFISTMPLRELIFSLSPAPPDKVLQAAHNLRYRDYLTVVLVIDRENVFPDNWIYIHTPEVKLGRIQNYKNWSAAMVPDTSKTALGLEYFLWEQDAEWKWPDERLIETGIRECVQIGLIRPGEVLDGTVVRMKKAYPVYDNYYHRSLAIIRRYLEQFSNLQTIGRNGLHRYNNQDHSMMTGVYAARNIFGETNDVWSVNIEQEYHEESRPESSASGERLVPMRPRDHAPEPQHTFDEIVEEAYAGQVVEELFARLDTLAMGIAVGTVSGLICAIGILLLFYHPANMPELSGLTRETLGLDPDWVKIVIGITGASGAGFLLGSSMSLVRNCLIKFYLGFTRKRVEASQTQAL